MRIFTEPIPVRHGYTVADLSRLAGVVLTGFARRGSADLDEKRSIAIHAMIEELYRHDCDPGSSFLMRAANIAIDTETRHDWSERGYNSKTREWQKGFPVYWHAATGTPLDEAVAERVATPQITVTLTDRQREVLAALVETGDRRSAAKILGIDPTTVSAVLGNARRAFIALWLEGETPRQRDFRAGRSNPYSPEAAGARPEIARRAVRVREARRASLIKEES